MDGVIYYNVGKKCLVRLAVSVSTAVRVVKAPITIICDSTSFEECRKIGKVFGIGILCKDFDDDREKNWVLLNKCRLHDATPYDRTIFIDSDTIVLKDFSDAFDFIDENDFIVTQMSNWKSAGRKYKKRIEAWRVVLDDSTLNKTYNEPKAVNTGFYGWRNGASIFDTWYDTAKINRLSFIPDEIACQIILPEYSHKVIQSHYNTSCKHDKITDESRSIHFHGRKHCRIQDGQYLYNSKLWYNEFDKIKNIDLIKGFIDYDRMLKNNIGAHNAA